MLPLFHLAHYCVPPCCLLLCANRFAIFRLSLGCSPLACYAALLLAALQLAVCHLDLPPLVIVPLAAVKELVASSKWQGGKR